MQVIVKTSGFYGGTWYEATPVSVEMPERVAKPFLQPYGDQLALPSKTVDKAGEKRGDKKVF